MSGGHQEDSLIYLLGDIGGTNLRLELRRSNNKLIYRKDSLSNSYDTISDALKDFIRHSQVSDLQNVLMCVCIAAKVENNTVVACSNIKWPYAKGDEVKREFGILGLTKVLKSVSC